MNRTEKQTAQRILSKYVDKKATELDTLKELDKKANRPANIFAYVFGSVSAVIMGAGMSLVMTDIGTILGMNSTLVPGIAIGLLGMIMALVNYPFYKKIMSARKAKYAPEILAVSDKIMNK